MCYALIYNKEARPNMGRTSTKENKNSYQLAREELGLTREKASELLETIAPERISLTVETLQLWTERMLASGQIDADEYKRKLGE